MADDKDKRRTDEILTIDEVASILKCKRSCVYELTRQRSRARQEHPIPFLKMPFGLRFRRSDIEAWLDVIARADK
ncbi:MAG: helix-turn-helix domain-containing protein [Terriglobales bacterium]